MPILSGKTPNKKPSCENSQKGLIAGTGFESQPSNTVNYGGSCVSEDGWGLKMGLVDAKRAILDIFMTLDMESRREVVNVLERLVTHAPSVALSTKR